MSFRTLGETGGTILCMYINITVCTCTEYKYMHCDEVSIYRYHTSLLRSVIYIEKRVVSIVGIICNWYVPASAKCQVGWSCFRGNHQPLVTLEPPL